jgi:hypothetical protein
MFWLHETTRRALCRRAFLLGCLVPILSVGGWIGWTRLDATRRVYEVELADQLGLSAVCSEVRFPRPGVVQYHWLILSRRESSAEIARIPLLEIDRSGDMTLVTIDSVKIDAPDLPTFWELVWDAMGRNSSASLRLSIADLTIASAAAADSFANVGAQVEPIAGGARITFQYPTGKPGTAPLCQVRVARLRNTTADTVKIEVQSSAAPLPCSLLAPFCAAAARLGPASRFQGMAYLQASPGGWSGSAAGKFSRVDLASLVAEPLGYQMQGEAELVIERAELRGGRIQHAQGQVIAGAGQVDRQLLANWQTHLGIELAKLPTSEVKQTFDQAAFRFALDAQGVELRGQCGREDSGILLLGTDLRPLALQREFNKFPLSALLRSLSPDSRELLPATWQATEIARWLPLPASNGTTQN